MPLNLPTGAAFTLASLQAAFKQNEIEKTRQEAIMRAINGNVSQDLQQYNLNKDNKLDVFELESMLQFDLDQNGVIGGLADPSTANGGLADPDTATPAPPGAQDEGFGTGAIPPGDNDDPNDPSVVRLGAAAPAY